MTCFDNVKINMFNLIKRQLNTNIKIVSSNNNILKKGEASNVAGRYVMSHLKSHIIIYFMSYLIFYL